MLEELLSTKGKIFAAFKPKFVLVGSIPEGTRIGLPNEMDIMVTFDAFEGLFKGNSTSAFGLGLTEEGNIFLSENPGLGKQN